jgi:hypothetical protein
MKQINFRKNIVKLFTFFAFLLIVNVSEAQFGPIGIGLVGPPGINHVCGNNQVSYTFNTDCGVNNGSYVTNAVYVTGGTILSQTPGFGGSLIVTVRWDCSATSGTINVTEFCPDHNPTDLSLTYQFQIDHIPTNLGTVTGPTSIACCDQSNVTYCIPVPICVDHYSWTFPTGWTVISGGNSNCITLKPDNSHGGTVRVSAQDFCFNSGASQITVTRTLPTLTIDIPCLCPERTVTLTANLNTCDPSNVTYDWTLPSDWTVNSTSSNTINCTVGASTGAQTISVVAHTPCGDVSVSRNIHTGTPQAPTVHFDSYDWYFYIYYYAISPSDDNCIVSYEWKLADGDVIETSTVPAAGLPDFLEGRSVCVRSVNDCGDRSDWTCFTIGDRFKKSFESSKGKIWTENSFEKEVVVSPNPTASKFEVLLPDPSIVNEMNLVSPSGGVVKKIDPFKHNFIDVSDLSSGKYLLVIRTNSFTVIKNVIVVK